MPLNETGYLPLCPGCRQAMVRNALGPQDLLLHRFSAGQVVTLLDGNQIRTYADADVLVDDLFSCPTCRPRWLAVLPWSMKPYAAKPIYFRELAVEEK